MEQSSPKIQYSTIVQIKHSCDDADSINEKEVKLGQNFYIFAYSKQTDERIWMNWTTFHARKISFHLKKTACL